MAPRDRLVGLAEHVALLGGRLLGERVAAVQAWTSSSACPDVGRQLGGELNGRLVRPVAGHATTTRDAQSDHH